MKLYDSDMLLIEGIAGMTHLHWVAPVAAVVAQELSVGPGIADGSSGPR